MFGSNSTPSCSGIETIQPGRLISGRQSDGINPGRRETCSACKIQKTTRSRKTKRKKSQGQIVCRTKEKRRNKVFKGKEKTSTSRLLQRGDKGFSDHLSARPGPCIGLGARAIWFFSLFSYWADGGNTRSLSVRWSTRKMQTTGAATQGSIRVGFGNELSD